MCVPLRHRPKREQFCNVRQKNIHIRYIWLDDSIFRPRNHKNRKNDCEESLSQIISGTPLYDVYFRIEYENLLDSIKISNENGEYDVFLWKTTKTQILIHFIFQTWFLPKEKLNNGEVKRLKKHIHSLTLVKAKYKVFFVPYVIIFHEIKYSWNKMRARVGC